MMLEPHRQMHFALSCSDAAFGYAAAATAAYGALANQMLEVWKSAMPLASEPEPRSWYRHPDRPSRSDARFALSLAPWVPFLNWADPRAAHGAAAPPVNPYAAMLEAWSAAPGLWIDLWTMRRAPVAWPMAFMMMAAGLPRAVAVPAAEANAAVLDAASVASEAMQNAYSRYRSDGGHAVAHIVFAKDRAEPALSMMAFAVAPIAWPWLNGATRTFA